LFINGADNEIAVIAQFQGQVGTDIKMTEGCATG